MSTTSATALVQQGFAAQQRGDLAAAQALYQRALSLDEAEAACSAAPLPPKGRSG